MGNSNKRIGPLTDDEVLSTLNTTGYPLEMRVFERLRATGLDPIFGHRVGTDAVSSATKEVDIVVELTAHCEWADGKQASATLGFYIQTKNIIDGGVIGFVPNAQAIPEDLAHQRSPFAGMPSYRLDDRTHDGVALMLAVGSKIAPALSALNSAPYCIQWAVARRQANDKKPIEIDQEHRVWEAVATTVKGCAFEAQRLTRLALQGGDPTPEIYFLFPVLVVDAPLWTFDIQANALKRVNSLLVTVAIDTVRGVVHSLIDIVTEEGLDEMIAGFRTSHSNLEQSLRSAAPTLASAAARQIHEFTVQSLSAV